MKIKSKQLTTSKTDFFYRAFRNILIIALPLTIISGLVLSHLSLHSSASSSSSGTDTVTLNLSTSCTISSALLSEHTINLNGGQHGVDIGNTKVNTYCNDNNGYNIYAVGYSGDTDIDTATGDSVSITPPTINNDYNNYNIVPSVYTLVASRASGTNMTTDTTASGSYFNTTYGIYASSVQPAGTYVGKVKYLMTHPNTNAPSTINDVDAAFAMAGKQKVYQDNNGSYYAM